jgi:hypothetical protein
MGGELTAEFVWWLAQVLFLYSLIPLCFFLGGVMEWIIEFFLERFKIIGSVL